MNTIPLKYPVVLVHGVVAHDRKVGTKFWGRIPDTLRKSGIQVFFGNTDSWGAYESNAAILKNTTEKILLETKKEKVNIIAHSKGGIDSRYFIWKYDFGDKIASLTTICTPHHGSEVSDLLDKQKIVHTKFSRKALKIFDKLCGDTNPDIYNVNLQLTTRNMEEFNKSITMDGGVYYQSLYTTMTNAFDDFMFFYSYRYIKKINGNNDGLVSEFSANWGSNVKKIHDGISHGEIVDLKKKNISGIDIPGIYTEIVRDLGDRGF